MSTVTIPKIEYKELKKIAERYKTIIKIVGSDVPEESLKEYANASQTKKLYLASLPKSSRR